MDIYDLLKEKRAEIIRTAAEHGIEPKAQKGGDHGQDDDFDDHVTQTRLAWASARRTTRIFQSCLK